jgi:predicted transcriptional regulator
MTISISRELEARVLDRAANEGKQLDVVSEELLSAALDWDEEQAATIEGVRRGLEASAAGRVSPADEVFARMRARLASTVRP